MPTPLIVLLVGIFLYFVDFGIWLIHSIGVALIVIGFVWGLWLLLTSSSWRDRPRR